MTLARRLLPSAGGGSSFNVPAFSVSGPYAPDYDAAATVLTQVHCHTTSSDGSYSPATVVAGYAAAGYGALAITDHDTVTSQPAGVTSAIVANELSPTEQHIISLGSDYTRGGATSAQTLIDGVVADGGVAEIAHPLWSAGMTFAEMDALTAYAGLEIHNQHVVSKVGSDSPVTFPGFAIERWDALLQSARRDLWGFSVDDLHATSAFKAYDMGRLRVFAPSNTPTNVLAGIASGNFVADVGNYGVTPGFPTRTPSGLAVACTGATRIEAWGTGGLLSASDATSHAHTFDGTEEYVRLVAIGDYTEAFGSALSDRWEAVDGTWTVGSGILSVSSDVTARRIVLRRQREGDFQAQVDMRISAGGTDAAALLFNVLDSDHYYMVRIGESTVSGYNNQLAVALTTNNSFANDSQLDNFAFDPTASTWYTVKVDYAAGRIRAKVWEVATMEPDWQVDVTDTTWTAGAFAFRANRSCAYDNLYINGFRTYYQPVAVS